MYKSDDFHPYLYKTSDYGKTWKKIVNGIPANAFTRVVREDPNHKGLLVAGTEFGLYISYDDGENWKPFQLNIPITPITDVAFHKREQEMVVAHRARAFYVLDDVPLLYQLKDSVPDRRCAFVQAQRHLPLRRRRTRGRRWTWAAPRGRESSGRRGGVLLPEGPAPGRSDSGIPGLHRQTGEEVLEQSRGAAPGAASDEEDNPFRGGPPRAPRDPGGHESLRVESAL